MVERRQTLPILANVLLVVRERTLSLTATDMEVELVASRMPSSNRATGEITVPARKLVDICQGAARRTQKLSLRGEGGKLLLRSGRSRFTLATCRRRSFRHGRPAGRAAFERAAGVLGD